MNTLIYYFKRILDIIIKPKQTIRKTKNYLKDGKYCISKDYTTIYLENSNFFNNEIFSNIEERKRLKKKVSVILSKRRYNVKTRNEKKFQGTTLIISSTKKQYKIFDYQKNLILTSYVSNDQFIKCVNNYKYLSKIYNMPKINRTNETEKYTIEENIIKYDYTSNSAINFIITVMADKAAFFSKTEIYNKSFDNHGNKMIELFQKNYNEIALEQKFLIKCHGDLWRYNILFNKEFYVIDSENVGHFLFFYDLLYYIFTDSYLLKNDKLIENYFKGVYDKQLNKLFNAFQCHYFKEKKLTYFYAFLYEYIIDRWNSLGKHEIQKEFKRLSVYLNKIEVITNE